MPTGRLQAALYEKLQHLKLRGAVGIKRCLHVLKLNNLLYLHISWKYRTKTLSLNEPVERRV
jgi:hypothetical protein